MTMTKMPSRKTWYAYGHGPRSYSFSFIRLQGQGGGVGVKQGRFVILRFSCFAVFGVSKIPRCWEKTAQRVSLSHPSLCVPQMLVKTRT